MCAPVLNVYKQKTPLLAGLFEPEAFHTKIYKK